MALEEGEIAVKYANETKAEFAERIMREHGFIPRKRSMRTVNRSFTTEQQKAESEAIWADMMARHDARFLPKKEASEQ